MPTARPNRPSPPTRRPSRLLGASIALTGLLFYQAGALDASDPEGPQDPIPAEAFPVDPEVSPAAAADRAGDVAEQVARLERAIRSNREELEKQRARLVDGPDTPYRRSEREFNELDARSRDVREALREATDLGEEDRAGVLEAELGDLTPRRQLARDRFDLEVRERQAANEQVEILGKAIAADERRLRELLGDEPPPPAGDRPAEPPGASDASAGPAAEAASAAAEAASPTAPPAPGPEAPGAPPAAAAPPAQPTSEEVVRARRRVDATAEAAEKAERRSRTLDERLGLIDRNIASIREQLRNAQLKADNARQTRDLLVDEFRDASIAGAPAAELQPLRDRVREAEDAVRRATAEVRDRTARLEEQRDERDLIVESREAVLVEAASARVALEAARAALREASNPLSPRNLSRWAMTRGPGILTILLVAAFLIWMLNRFGGRVASMIADRGTRGSQAEREDRARTLVGVFQNAATAVIVIGASIMALDQAGVPIAPLLGGAAVLGLAISFGAQNLVSDFFYGFMILLENQYKLNDVVRINDHSGQVERITLRMTALRDLEGNLHFIPNGQVNAVVNMTHGWSRALFDVGVSYKENVDRVMEVILELGRELRKDPRFRPLILEDPTMLGVDAFADSAVMIKFFIKTRPLQQWTVKRELLRRLKNRFDELGIEIPFPHRTVYHRSDDLGFSRLTVEAERGNGASR